MEPAAEGHGPTSALAGVWRPASVNRFIRGFGTSTNVMRVETDAGEGFLKALGNPAGPHALACDLVGTALAARLGLPVFDYAIVTVTADSELPFERGGHARAGPGFITRAERGTSWDGSAALLALTDNTAIINTLVAFDNWVRNCDRHPPDTATRRPNYDNLFLSEENAARGRFLLRIIDHGHVFDCGHDLTTAIDHIDIAKDDRLYGVFPEFWPLLTKDGIRAALAAIRAVERHEIQARVAAIPAEWQVPEPTRAALVSMLVYRGQFLEEYLPGKLWPQRELYGNES